MSVIGIDFGNESCYVATAKAGGIETLANDYSMRATPSCVAFDGRKRILGVGAKNQQVTNMKNTVGGFKRLIGRKFNDPHVQKEIKNIPLNFEERADGKIGVIVNYLGERQSFTPEQLTAMLFTKLKETSAHAMQTQVNDCVITCPVYFTNAERKALLEAAEISGLHVLRLMNETTATALAYGFYKPELQDDKPHTVLFVDCGQSSLQVSACLFTKGRLKMLGSTWDQIGGRDFDRAIADHFIEEFEKKYKVDVRNNPRAMLRLMTECEKLKRQMSANSTPLPLNIECFMDDMDVSSVMQRSTMEELCQPLFDRVEHTFRQLLVETRIDLSTVHAVEIVGGTSRIPAIKQLIETVFGKPASTTLNQDESVARGAALQCAIMSPAVRVRDFGVTDIQNYTVKVCWESDGSLQAGEIVVFPQFHAVPFSRLLTLNRKVPFTLTVQYADLVPYTDSVIGKWHINLKPNDNYDYQEVKIKVRINQHGIVLISNASIERSDQVQEQVQQGGQEQVGIEKTESFESNANPAEADKKKKSSKATDLQVDCITQSAAAIDELNKFVQQELNMVENDAKEILRVDAKNTLEEYIYESRNKLQGSLERFVTEKERSEVCKELEELENWLYEDGEDCEREIYTEKYEALKERIEAIGKRQTQFQQTLSTIAELEKAISVGQQKLVQHQKGAPLAATVTANNVLELREGVLKAENWLKKNLQSFREVQPTHNANVNINELNNELKSLQALIDNVVYGPKENGTTIHEIKIEEC